MSFLLILPFALTEGPAIFRTQRLREHISRGVCGSVAMMCGFYPDHAREAHPHAVKTIFGQAAGRGK